MLLQFTFDVVNAKLVLIATLHLQKSAQQVQKQKQMQLPQVVLTVKYKNGGLGKIRTGKKPYSIIDRHPRAKEVGRVGHFTSNLSHYEEWPSFLL